MEAATLEAITGISAWMADNPVLVLVAAGAILLASVARRAAAAHQVPTDPQRLFDPAQRREIHRRAGNRCEHKPLLLPRCRHRGEQADHIYPWSRGGATALQNGASLCAKHNRRKSARIPSVFYRASLERRRQRYFPDGVDPRIEWRIGVAR